MSFCYKTAIIWQVVGYVFLIAKIVIPIILIILGMVDLGKAVISSDDKAISKVTKSLLMRTIAAIAIFFIPTIIKVAFEFVAGFNEDMKNDAQNCIDCLTSPNGSCDTSYEGEVFPT